MAFFEWTSFFPFFLLYAIPYSSCFLSFYKDLGNSNLSGHLVPKLGKLEHLQYLYVLSLTVLCSYIWNAHIFVSLVYHCFFILLILIHASFLTPCYMLLVFLIKDISYLCSCGEGAWNVLLIIHTQIIMLTWWLLLFVGLIIF